MILKDAMAVGCAPSERHTPLRDDTGIRVTTITSGSNLPESARARLRVRALQRSVTGPKRVTSSAMQRSDLPKRLLMRTMLALGIALVVTTACGGSSTAPANSCGSSGASANVNATDSKVFSPSTVTITHGQSVCWQNNGNFSHTVTSDDGTSFNTGLPSGQIFVHVFPAAGSFPYHCTIHTGMAGTITVN